MSFGGRNQEQSMQALKTLQSKVAAKMQEQVSAAVSSLRISCVQDAHCATVSLPRRLPSNQSTETRRSPSLFKGIMRMSPR